MTLFSTKFAGLNKPRYIEYASTDTATVKEMRDAAYNNFFMGASVGMNTITGDKSDELINRNPSFKDKQFFQEFGYYPSPTTILLA